MRIRAAAAILLVTAAGYVGAEQVRHDRPDDPRFQALRGRQCLSDERYRDVCASSHPDSSRCQAGMIPTPQIAHSYAAPTNDSSGGNELTACARDAMPPLDVEHTRPRLTGCDARYATADCVAPVHQRTGDLSDAV